MSELRFIKDFPKKGVNYVDITPVIQDPNELRRIIDEMSKNVPSDADFIIAPASRGYLFGTGISLNTNKGFVTVMKEGKLPDDLVIKATYEKEYGPDTLCIPTSENYAGKKFYFVDDILATGGTLGAIKELIEKVGGIYLGGCVYINLHDLNNEKIDCVISMKA